MHKVLGPGYLESVYQGALCRELTLRQIPFVSQPPVWVLSYLKATHLKLGLLINFNVPFLKGNIRRVVRTQ